MNRCEINLLYLPDLVVPFSYFCVSSDFPVDLWLKNYALSEVKILMFKKMDLTPSELTCPENPLKENCNLNFKSPRSTEWFLISCGYVFLYTRHMNVHNEQLSGSLFLENSDAIKFHAKFLVSYQITRKVILPKSFVLKPNSERTSLFRIQVYSKSKGKLWMFSYLV